MKEGCRMRAVLIKFIGLLLIANLFCLTPVVADELNDRDHFEIQLKLMLHRKRFKEIEEFSDRFNKSKERTPSGIPELGIYDEAVRGWFTENFSMGFSPNEKTAPDIAVEEWIRQNPRSASAHIAYGELLLEKGWSYRGTGSMSSVSPADYQTFQDYVEKSRAYLEDHKAMAASNPIWYDTMLDIGGQQGWFSWRYNGLFLEAVNKHPAYLNLYFTAAKYALPRWGGSKERLEAIARMAMQKTRATDGDGMYARIYWTAEEMEYGGALFDYSDADWPTMSRSIDAVLAKYPDQWNINMMAKLACIAGDRAKTKALIDRITNPPAYQAWFSGPGLERCRAFAMEKG